MAYLLVSNNDANQRQRGEIQVAKDTNVWGKAERLPNWIRLEVTGATADQVNQYTENLKGFLMYTIDAENAQGWRVTMTVDQALIDATGIDASFKQDLKDYILNDPHEGNWSASQHAQSPTSLTVDIAKGQPFDLPDIKADVDDYFRDKLETQTGFQRYFFDASTMDAAQSAGETIETNNEDGEGNIPSDLVHFTRTVAQVMSLIQDRLNP